ncbi:hypothetical protein QRX50_05410 [Amycolatopsis carbonis]|uniref:Uncharacterized protein n=1 Tax=Amycolatopsis carbonis TaxID=715471 RepID=A0A9Y2IHL5_9PSEU|nr:hypothetical protein [Amycolatopsis sp. 2-15]WIX80227.1 hypothetical protein QRX50_05410 [Amycolatopsis sp. 2-15]
MSREVVAVRLGPALRTAGWVGARLPRGRRFLGGVARLAAGELISG